MTISVGIGLAFVAMLCWGIGDFLIQKSTRKIGDWETLFIITAFGTLVLLPFVYRDIPEVLRDTEALSILVACGLFLLVAALLEFEAFKHGKLSVLEPLLSLEIPTAAILALAVLGDKANALQILLIITLIIGLCLVSFRERYFGKHLFLERGVILFVFGAILMGVGDFFLGWGARATDPLMANFALNVVIAGVSGGYLLFKGKLRKMFSDVGAHQGFLLAMSITDNVAWIAYAFAMSLVPIAVATGLSESSVIVAVVLGLVVNRERLKRHQKFGLIVALAAAIFLAAVTAG